LGESKETSLICRREVDFGRLLRLFDVRPPRLVTVGDRSCSTAGPRLWNSLPEDDMSKRHEIFCAC